MWISLVAKMAALSLFKCAEETEVPHGKKGGCAHI